MNICASATVETKTENKENEDSLLDLIPRVNLKEPEPDDDVFKWAETHIGENPNTKVMLLEELRDMIFERGECDPHRTDDEFLLRFLRARHFIVRMAHRLIANYYTFRENNPDLFFNLDFNRLLEVGESEIFSVPPYLDQDGRRILIVRFEKWDPSQFTTDELFQTIIFLIHTASLEPKFQILGGTCILDVGNIGAGQAWYLTPTIVKQMMAVTYSSLPLRIEKLHIINVSRIFDYAFSMIKPLLSDVMKERILIHPDLDSLHQHVPPTHLPKRFGGSHKDYLFNDWLASLKENEEFLEEMTSYGYIDCKDFVKRL